jgi:arylsulfatase A-like enzyme
MIKSPGRLSEETMHIVDWLPTLYTAAGGNVDDLGDDIDGINQWPSIAEGLGSPRESLLLNIDEMTNTEAAIVGKYKLVKGGYSIYYIEYIVQLVLQPIDMHTFGIYNSLNVRINGYRQTLLQRQTANVFVPFF